MKKKILNFINKFLEVKIDILKQELNSLHKDKNEITKSSAGDKFETGRSLIQIEIDKLDNQYLQLKNATKFEDYYGSVNREFLSLYTISKMYL